MGLAQLGHQYWHLTTKGFNPLLHNVRLGKGWTASIDHSAQQTPGMTTLYAYQNEQPEKEAVWEQVRIEIDPVLLPPRLNGFFAFLSADDAQRAQAKWGLDNRYLVEVYAGPGAKVHLADSELLVSKQEEWATNAGGYWRGDRTQTPLIEVLISGPIFFPKWELPPFGMLLPNGPVSE